MAKHFAEEAMSRLISICYWPQKPDLNKKLFDIIYFLPNASKKRLKKLHLNSLKVDWIFISDNMSELALALAQELISSAPVVTEEGKQVEKAAFSSYIDSE